MAIDKNTFLLYNRAKNMKGDDRTTLWIRTVIVPRETKNFPYK